MSEQREMIAPWGVMLPNFNPFGLDPWPYLDVVRAVEGSGFDAGWVGDHLAFHPPVIEATNALAAAAAVTSSMKLGFAVLLGAMREPVWLAKALMSIDQLAPGRVIVGLGAGGEHPPEWRAAGAEISNRGPRLDELLGVLPDLLTGRPVFHRGPHLSVEAPPLRPAMATPPPVVIGGRSDAALRRAARFGQGWLGVWVSPEGFERSVARLNEFAVETGRLCPEPMLLAFAAIGDDASACDRDAAQLFRGQYDLRYDQVKRWTLTGSADHVAQRLAEYRVAGARSIAIIPARPDLLGQVEQIASVRELLDA
jgi:alkanesulfonate monooxygenase SsuD/methylene tetrahydromethanopterin reductase-like flavin-dependent oxidoreductase (luciferase family)